MELNKCLITVTKVQASDTPDSPRTSAACLLCHTDNDSVTMSHTEQQKPKGGVITEQGQGLPQD